MLTATVGLLSWGATQHGYAKKMWTNNLSECDSCMVKIGTIRDPVENSG